MAFAKRFSELTKSSIDEQAKFFQTRYIFNLGDAHVEILDITEKFKEAVERDNPGKSEMSARGASSFLQANGRAARSANQIKEELKDVDQDGNGLTSLIEYLMLHYKVMMLKEYFDRKGSEPDIELDDDSMVGLTGVGDKLVEELFAPPAGLDTDLEKMMEEFQIDHTKRRKALAELEEQVAGGGVKGMAAKNQLVAQRQKDDTELNAVEAKIAAAINRTKKKAEAELAKRMEEYNEAQAAKSKSKPVGGLGDLKSKFGG